MASPKNSTESRLPPPKKNHHTCNGGGERGIQRGVAQARQCTSPIPPYTSRASNSCYAVLLLQCQDHQLHGMDVQHTIHFDEDREFRDDGLLRLVRYPSKLYLLFGWILRRERSVSGIGGQTEAYEVNHCAHLLKICRCDDASVRDIFGGVVILICKGPLPLRCRRHR